ncbi:hypothetical protein BGZ76_010693 [Entomortierella beljakovae]|nr:hypothetical protein BGZ76_010693 [Entomortierella beljakovae]
MDDSQLRYYFPPDLTKPNNLSVNYEKYISRGLTVDEHLDALLDALMCIRDQEDKREDEKEKTSKESEPDTTDTTETTETSKDGSDSSKQQQKPSATKVDFICYRGILTKIMCTPYNRNDPWELRATLYKGTIYIEEHVTPEKRLASNGEDDRHKLMSYWGYRFETICNISKPPSELRKTRVRKPKSNQLEDDYGLNSEKRPRSNTGSPALPSANIIGSNDSPKEPSTYSSSTLDVGNDKDDDEYIEQVDLQDPELTGRYDGIVDTNIQYCTVARTKIGRNSVIMGAEVDCISGKYKLLKFWAQSFLPGIPTIIVGFRDDDGNVINVETFKTMEIPRLVRGSDGAWDSTICINFLDGVFNFLRKHIVIDDPEVTYTIRWAAPFTAIQIDHEGKKNGFLTERFLTRWESI